MAAPTPPTPAACRTCGQHFDDGVLICPHDGSHLPLEHRLLGDKYRLQKRIGQGAMASVWRATHELIQRPVAIKLMHKSYADDADLLARFRNEATAAGRIRSPHICDVLDFGRSDIGPYIVMELLSGCSLIDLFQRYQRLDPGLAVWIVRQALEGLDAAHRAGIVHRDLKPENIYLSRAIRDQWIVKLMDFGISKFTDSLRTGAGTMMGSPNYMAPEQIHGAAAVDPRADLWSIGAILYEALAGQQAFARDSIADSLAAVRSHDPPPIHALAPDVPPGLSAIVARCLRKHPDQRWPSARALSDALVPFETPGPRTRLLPTTPIGDLDPAPLAPPVRSARPTGPHPPVPAARSTGPHPPVPAARSTGPHPPVPAARPTGPHPSVPAARSTGPHPPVPAARPTGPHPPVPAARPTGPHPPVPAARPTGPHPPVPAARSTAPHPPVSPARSTGPRPPVPAARSTGPHPSVHPPARRPAGPSGGRLPVPAAASPAGAALPTRSTARRRHKPGQQNLLAIVIVLALVASAAAAVAWRVL